MEENLSNLIETFYEEKQEFDKYKKSTEEYNKQIKESLNDLGKTEFETESGLVAKMSTQQRESFNEAKLIEKLKELKVTSPIKTVEVVDMDELENVIYNEGLDASELTNCKIVKEVVTLKVSKKKGA